MATDTIRQPSALFRAALFSLLVLFLQGCSGDDLSGADSNTAPEPASLVLTAELPRLSASVDGTRAGSRSFDDIDKNEISRLAVFLVDRDKDKLVAYRNIYPNPEEGAVVQGDRNEDNGFLNADGEIDPTLEEGKTARLTFPYDVLLHGESERLSRGNYTLLAVANYRNSTNAGYDTEAKVDAVITKFNESNGAGIAGFMQDETCKEMFNLVLKMPREKDGKPSTTGEQPYLRPSDVAMPASCALDLPLIAGMNEVSLNLSRVCARVRIDVKNYSEYPLTVHDLELSKNFTQSGCFLIPRRQTDRNYTEWEEWNSTYQWDSKGAPNVQHQRAIKPFAPDTEIKKMATETIFDGLIYESRDLENAYTYTLDVEYKGQTGYVYFDLANSGYITQAKDVKAGYYLIKRQTNNDFIFATETNPKVTTSGNLSEKKIVAESQKEYFWELVSDNRSYKLRNVGTDEYIQFPSKNNSPLTMVATQNNASTVTFVNSGNSGIALQSGSYYANVSGANLNRGNNNTSARFVLIPLERHEEAQLKHTITLTTIDPVTAEVFPVHEIRRNDYIHVLVEVQYNPDKGDFEFIVSRWDKGGGEIDYN